MRADVLIAGGGVAGLSLAAEIAATCRVVVLEAEDSLGHHSSGRSATFSHFGIGNRVVRGLTFHSRAFFQSPPTRFSDVPLARRASALFVATPPMLPALEQLQETMVAYAPSVRGCDEAEMSSLFPPLRTGGEHAVAGLLDEDGLRIDSEAMLQGYARAVRAAAGSVVTGSHIRSVVRRDGCWTVEASGTTYEAPVLVNAAGAWADQLAALAGVPALGLDPKRRTIIIVDPPEGADVRLWPFVKTVVDDFYILPESGRLAASPVDEVPSDPCDAQPEEYDVALAAAKVEEYTKLEVRRVGHRWAGLRTFAADRSPVAGFDPRAEGFFWLAGQGGFGLQTGPAMAEAAAALLLGRPWPEGLARQGVASNDIAPERLIHG